VPSALVVDGDPGTVRELAAILASLRIDATVLADGEAAVDRARSLQPSFIFVRAELPRISGFAVCNHLRGEETTRKIPVILYSNDLDAGVFDQHRKLRRRANAYLHLPLDTGRVQAAIASCTPIATSWR
jgi:CheY-like chemotaxis protein